MKVRNIHIRIEEYHDESALPRSDQELLKEAVKAVDSSYAPYSDFHVGAAVLLDNGEIIPGSNQENAAYPSGLCAERVALFYAKSKYPDSVVESLAITARADHFDLDYPLAPCGSCRQVIAEVENRQSQKIKIILRGETGTTQVIKGIENLLPLVFKEESLKRSKKK